MQKHNFSNFRKNEFRGFYFQGKKFDVLIVIEILLFMGEMLLGNLLYQQPIWTHSEMANHFHKSIFYIHKLLTSLKATLEEYLPKNEELSEEDIIRVFSSSIFFTVAKIESKAKKKKKNRNKKKLKKCHGEYIKQEIKNNPSIYLQEIKVKLKQDMDLDVSISSLYKHIRYELQYTHKKLMLRSPRKFLPEYEQYSKMFQQKMEKYFEIYDKNHIIFLDETGVNIHSSSRGQGWAQIGQNSLAQFSSNDLKHRINSIAALNIKGFLCVTHFHTTIKKEQFLFFMLDVLIPVIDQDTIIVMDNCRIHHSVSSQLLPTLLSKNSFIEYLPPYSPELNPIEMAFGNLKRKLKHFTSEFKENPMEIWDQMFHIFNDTQKAKRYFEEDYPFLKK